MFKKILEQFNYKKKYKELLDILDKSTPELVIRKIMGRGIEWYDYNDISDINHKRRYYNDAQSILRNETFKNEINHLLSDQINYLARESKNHEDTMNIRMTINAIDLIKERLESIYDPDKEVSKTDEIYNAI